MAFDGTAASELLVILEQDLQRTEGSFETDILDLEKLFDACGFRRTDDRERGTIVFQKSEWRQTWTFRGDWRALPVQYVRDQILPAIRERLEMGGYV